MQCKAKARSTGKRCRRHAVNGYKVCQVHGAGSVHKGRPGGRPIVSGRYSKYLPNRLLARYQEAANDKNLLSLHHEIAVVEARITDIMIRVDTGEAGTHWQLVNGIFVDIMTAIRKQDSGTIIEAVNKGLRISDKGVNDYAAWNEIGNLFEQRRRLSESERKRLVEMENIVTAEQALMLMVAISDIIRKAIPDQVIVNQISYELSRLMNAEPQAEQLEESVVITVEASE